MATETVQREIESYAPGEDRPLGPYLVLTGVFGTLMTASLAVAKARGREIERPSGLDVLLAGLATQKLSRMIAKDKVTSFIRAPFTRYEEPAGYGELSEQPRGSGMRHALGELLVCPYCMAQWVAGGFGIGWVFAPRATRFVAAVWSAQAVADAAQLAYSAGERRS
jgi:Protein of unknown function (DUF1360)